jgi:ATP-dependent HslUV protease subunit HslV
VADNDITILLDGYGNCIEIEEGVCAVGSGGLYAQCKYICITIIAAAKALLQMDHLTALEVATRSMTIAADLCLHTNHNFKIELLEKDDNIKLLSTDK